MKRLFKSLIFALGLVVPIFLYLGWSLNSTMATVVLSVIFILIISFPFFRHGPLLLHLTFLSMGVFTYFIVFCVLKDVLALFGHSFTTEWIYWGTGLAVLAASMIARLGPKVNRRIITYPSLPPGLDGLTICQISDLHIGGMIRKKYVARVVSLINNLNPDIIAMTGDIGDGKVTKYKEDTLPLANLRARYGTFYVPGNHEYYWGGNEWLAAMNALGAVILNNRGKMLHVNGHKLLMGGIPDQVFQWPPDLESTLRGNEDADFKVLLSHRPGCAEEAAGLGFDLQLSGHTHGGQFFPWTVVVRFFHKRFLGLYQIDKLWLYVNSGTATWGPIMRLGTNSEITLFTLKSSAAKSLE